MVSAINRINVASYESRLFACAMVICGLERLDVLGTAFRIDAEFSIGRLRGAPQIS
jgi:hypothetical protein